MNPWNREPVVIIGFVKSVLYLVVLFGLSLSVEQISVVIVTAESSLALLARSQVTPGNGE